MKVNELTGDQVRTLMNYGLLDPSKIGRSNFDLNQEQLRALGFNPRTQDTTAPHAQNIPQLKPKPMQDVLEQDASNMLNQNQQNVMMPARSDTINMATKVGMQTQASGIEDERKNQERLDGLAFIETLPIDTGKKSDDFQNALRLQAVVDSPAQPLEVREQALQNLRDRFGMSFKRMVPKKDEYGNTIGAKLEGKNMLEQGWDFMFGAQASDFMEEEPFYETAFDHLMGGFGFGSRAMGHAQGSGSVKDERTIYETDEVKAIRDRQATTLPLLKKGVGRLFEKEQAEKDPKKKAQYRNLRIDLQNKLASEQNPSGMEALALFGSAGLDPLMIFDALELSRLAKNVYKGLKAGRMAEASSDALAGARAGLTDDANVLDDLDPAMEVQPEPEANLQVMEEAREPIPQYGETMPLPTFNQPKIGAPEGTMPKLDAPTEIPEYAPPRPFTPLDQLDKKGIPRPLTGGEKAMYDQLDPSKIADPNANVPEMMKENEAGFILNEEPNKFGVREPKEFFHGSKDKVEKIDRDMGGALTGNNPTGALFNTDNEAKAIDYARNSVFNELQPDIKELYSDYLKNNPEIVKSFFNKREAGRRFDDLRPEYQKKLLDNPLNFNELMRNQLEENKEDLKEYSGLVSALKSIKPERKELYKDYIEQSSKMVENLRKKLPKELTDFVDENLVQVRFSESPDFFNADKMVQDFVDSKLELNPTYIKAKNLYESRVKDTDLNLRPYGRNRIDNRGVFNTETQFVAKGDAGLTDDYLNATYNPQINDIKKHRNTILKDEGLEEIPTFYEDDFIYSPRDIDDHKEFLDERAQSNFNLDYDELDEVDQMEVLDEVMNEQGVSMVHASEIPEEVKRSGDSGYDALIARNVSDKFGYHSPELKSDIVQVWDDQNRVLKTDRHKTSGNYHIDGAKERKRLSDVHKLKTQSDSPEALEIRKSYFNKDFEKDVIPDIVKELKKDEDLYTQLYADARKIKDPKVKKGESVQDLDYDSPNDFYEEMLINGQSEAFAKDIEQISDYFKGNKVLDEESWDSLPKWFKKVVDDDFNKSDIPRLKAKDRMQSLSEVNKLKKSDELSQANKEKFSKRGELVNGYWKKDYNNGGVVKTSYTPADVGKFKRENESLVDLPEGVMVGDKFEKFGYNPELKKSYDKYMELAEKKYGVSKRDINLYADIDPERSRAIAHEYEKMKHEPNNPEVRSAYAQMTKEMMDQYKTLVDDGWTFTLMPHKKVDGEWVFTDPYGTPRDAIKDMRENKHLYVFPTKIGFGTGDRIKDNPLEVLSGVKFGDEEVYINDIFRAVHDVFGHGIEEVGFRPRGEEHTWRSHARMFSPEARRAVTTETRGQNSWLNFNSLTGKKNRISRVEDTNFADQKTGLMPKWVSESGLYDEDVADTLNKSRVSKGKDKVEAEKPDYSKMKTKGKRHSLGDVFSKGKDTKLPEPKFKAPKKVEKPIETKEDDTSDFNPIGKKLADIGKKLGESKGWFKQSFGNFLEGLGVGTNELEEKGVRGLADAIKKGGYKAFVEAPEKQKEALKSLIMEKGSTQKLIDELGSREGKIPKEFADEILSGFVSPKGGATGKAKDRQDLMWEGSKARQIEEQALGGKFYSTPSKELQDWWDNYTKIKDPKTGEIIPMDDEQLKIVKDLSTDELKDVIGQGAVTKIFARMNKGSMNYPEILDTIQAIDNSINWSNKSPDALRKILTLRKSLNNMVTGSTAKQIELGELKDFFGEGVDGAQIYSNLRKSLADATQLKSDFMRYVKIKGKMSGLDGFEIDEMADKVATAFGKIVSKQGQAGSKLENNTGYKLLERIDKKQGTDFAPKMKTIWELYTNPQIEVTKTKGTGRLEGFRLPPRAQEERWSPAEYFGRGGLPDKAQRLWKRAKSLGLDWSQPRSDLGATAQNKLIVDIASGLARYMPHSALLNLLQDKNVPARQIIAIMQNLNREKGTRGVENTADDVRTDKEKEVIFSKGKALSEVGKK